MLFSHILYAKVVDKEAKLNGAPFVAPKARSGGRLEVSCFVEAFAKEVISQTSALGQAIATFNSFEEYPSVILLCE